MSSWKFNKLLNLLESTGSLTPEEISKHISNAITAVMDIDSDDITVMPANIWNPNEEMPRYVYDAKFAIFYLKNLNDYLLTFTISSKEKLTHADLIKPRDIHFYASVVKVMDEEVDETQADFEVNGETLLDVMTDIKTFIDGFDNNNGDDDEDKPWSPEGEGSWEDFENEMETHEIVGARIRK